MKSNALLFGSRTERRRLAVRRALNLDLDNLDMTGPRSSRSFHDAGHQVLWNVLEWIE
jgi:hypothetical protein